MSTHWIRRCHPFFWAFAGLIFVSHPLISEDSKLLDPVAAKKMMDRTAAKGGKVVIIDVRAKTEYVEEHIPDAINISIRNEDGIVEELRKRQIGVDRVLLIYSGSGTRSRRMVEALTKADYGQAYGLDRGIYAWVSEGFVVGGERKTRASQRE